MVEGREIDRGYDCMTRYILKAGWQLGCNKSAENSIVGTFYRGEDLGLDI
jgi:hypothetical protein